MCDQSGCVNAKSLHHCGEHAHHHTTDATQQRWCISVEVIASESRRMIIKLASWPSYSLWGGSGGIINCPMNRRHSLGVWKPLHFKGVYQGRRHVNNYVRFPLKLTKVTCLIQGVWYKMLYHHTVVIKEWRDVARDVLYRTTLTWRHIIGMWDIKDLRLALLPMFDSFSH